MGPGWVEMDGPSSIAADWYNVHWRGSSCRRGSKFVEHFVAANRPAGCYQRGSDLYSENMVHSCSHYCMTF